MSMRASYYPVAKRIIDVIGAATGLLLLAPALLLVAIAIKLDSAGPVLFVQHRIGKDFRPFHLYKFRTMRCGVVGTSITYGADPRITHLGKFLRSCKIDELPQLFNVVKGDMSLVGPRPELDEFVRMFASEYATVLQVRPGMTDIASLMYRNEAALLGRARDPRQMYVERVLPHKLHLAREYVKNATLWLDCELILRSIWHCFHHPDRNCGPGSDLFAHDEYVDRDHHSKVGL